MTTDKICYNFASAIGTTPLSERVETVAKFLKENLIEDIDKIATRQSSEDSGNGIWLKKSTREIKKFLQFRDPKPGRQI